ncbi:MAG: 16S rRNA (uracil(1498)-N(3))-methyltransferase [Endomicrobiales bacterium]|jgi:16S rRNA (uracil1498-N3)-methyltransferase
MPHFFVPPENIDNGIFVLTGSEAHHLATVRRCTSGSVIDLFDGTGKTYVGTVTSVTHNEIKGTIVPKEDSVSPSVAICLYNAVPKGDRFDWLVEKAAELGVAVVVPMITQRSVIKDISEAKIERWNRLSRAASQQSARTDVMRVETPLSFDAAVEKTASLSSTRIIAWEGEETRTMQTIPQLSHPATEVSIFIGPEGGFSMREIEHAIKYSVIPVTLGKNVLRVETAGILATILAMNLAGQYT